MLGAFGNDPAEMAHLAKMERCEALVRYVAAAGQKFEPANAYWSSLLALLAPGAPPKCGVVPHPTRFIAMTGLTRRGVEIVTEWIRPSAQSLAHG